MEMWIGWLKYLKLDQGIAVYERVQIQVVVDGTKDGKLWPRHSLGDSVLDSRTRSRCTNSSNQLCCFLAFT